MSRRKVAVIGSRDIGTDLLIKIKRLSDVLEMGAMADIAFDLRTGRLEPTGP